MPAADGFAGAVDVATVPLRPFAAPTITSYDAPFQKPVGQCVVAFSSANDVTGIPRAPKELVSESRSSWMCVARISVDPATIGESVHDSVVWAAVRRTAFAALRTSVKCVPRIVV